MSGLTLALTVVIPEGVAAVFANSVSDSNKHHQHDTLDTDRHHVDGHAHNAHDNAKWLGLSLLAGFILMPHHNNIREMRLTGKSCISDTIRYIIDSAHKHDPPSHGPPRRKSRATLYRSASHHSELEPLSREANSADRSDFAWEEARAYSPAGHDRPSRPLLSRSSTQSSVTSSIAAERASHAFSTVVGLLVHSIADGVSLGASSMSSATSDAGPSTSSVDDVSLDLIIFLAIMVHKAPAAFALSSLLRSSCVSNFFRYRSLLAFSLAAPFGAILTYVFLNMIGADSSSQIGWWTGIVLVFSGGTFLFVATHVMQDDQSNSSNQPEHYGGTTNGRNSTGSSMEDDFDQHHHAVGVSSRLGKMALVISGMITPFVLTTLIGSHGHAH
ncbi:hypothetical protein OIV83_002978 [Microbotryomycetes sp. JL201]|nr:hypothetical protein OIV83_002978 [Microbotryomycetes sp. JL201]